MSTDKKIAKFITDELIVMGNNIVTSYNEAKSTSEHNPFRSLKDKTLEKNMNLGRSFDSQLGNHLQRIAFFLARIKYGESGAPNYIVISGDKDKGQICIWTISLPSDCGVDVYSTQICFCVSDYSHAIDEIQRKLISRWQKAFRKENPLNLRKPEDKKLFNAVTEKFYNAFKKSVIKQYTYVCSNPSVYKKLAKITKELPIDLFYIDGDAGKECITTYEIKASGNLDTKNCKSNADEVLKLLDLFSFFPQNESFFACCYNNQGEVGPGPKKNDGVLFNGCRPSGSIFNIYSKTEGNRRKWKKMKNRMIVGSVFWERVLPDGINYNDFISIYQKAFKKSEIEKKIQSV